MKDLDSIIAKTAPQLWRKLKFDASAAAQTETPFDLDALRQWARECFRRTEETLAEKEVRLDAYAKEHLSQGERECNCEGTGWMREFGWWRFTSDPNRRIESWHVKRCVRRPGRDDEFWKKEPNQVDRLIREMVCPAAVRFLMRRQRATDAKPVRR